MTDFIRARLDDLGEHGDNGATVIFTDFLHIGIHLGPFLFVKFRPGGHQQLVEFFVIPFRIVPGTAGCIGYGKHQVLRRTPAPVTHYEFFLCPDVIPVAVAGFPYHIDLDAGFFGMLLIQDGGIVGTLKGGFGGVQVKRVVLHAGLLHVEFGLFRIVLPFWEIFGKIAVDRCDGVVVAGLAVAV